MPGDRPICRRFAGRRGISERCLGTRGRCSVVLVQTTELANLQVFPCSQSPLTDSNRRPPPYHGGFGLLLCDLERRLVERFPCNLVGFAARSTLPLNDPELP